MFGRKTGEAKDPAICRTGLYDKGLSHSKCSVRNHHRPRVEKVMETKNLPAGSNIFNIIISVTSAFKRSLNWVLRDLVTCFSCFPDFLGPFLLGPFLRYNDYIHFLVMFLIPSHTKLMQPTVN